MSDIHVTPGDEGPPIYVTDDDDETIIVNSDDTDPNVVVLPTEDPDPDIIFVVDEDEAPDIVHVTEDDVEPIMFGADDVQEIEVVDGPGPRGLKGDPGMSAYDVAVMEGFVGTEDEWLASLQGPQGTPGSAPQAYVHDQGTASDVWTIIHGLGYHPNVTVFDSGGTEWIGDIDYESDDALTITFTSAFGGKAYLS